MTCNAVEAQINAASLIEIDITTHSVGPSRRPGWPRGDAQAVVLRPAGRAHAKRVLDILGALAIAAIFSPFILAIAIVLHFQDGPILFRHRRIGRAGRTFECLKFRTMVPDAEHVLRAMLERDPEARSEWCRTQKLRNDPRVTRLGRILRRSSLDELPQLWNVLRGEMSLVGPRPIVREEMLRYGRYLSAYLTMPPGITGLWQIKGRNDTDYRRRVALDAYYARKQSLLMDLKILTLTPQVVIRRLGAY